MKLKISNITNGNNWTDDNISASWSNLAQEIFKNHKEFFLIHCNIEGIVKFNNSWIILDQYGKWQRIPGEYKVEEIS